MHRRASIWRETKSEKVRFSFMTVEQLPPLIIGGSVHNHIYNLDPLSLPTTSILDLAFENGFNAIDSSPYYGRLEQYFGVALAALKQKWPRESYYICTKAGRYGANDFDYSRTRVRASVMQSLQRFQTTYLDAVCMHDIEFVGVDEVMEALKELRLLKNEGLVRAIGVSGYPIELLYEVALAAKNDAEIGPLDVILLYSNGCLQNTRLFDVYDKFFTECGVKRLMNGSILSMSLLRSQSTHDFHPALDSLKAKAKQVAAHLKEKDIDVADLATRFAMRKTLYENGNLTNRSSVVLGVSSVHELELALENYSEVERKMDNEEEEEVYREVQRMFGENFNERWDSGRVKY